MMWSYGCREEKQVLPERCGIRITTIAARKRLESFPPNLYRFAIQKIPWRSLSLGEASRIPASVGLNLNYGPDLVPCMGID